MKTPAYTSNAQKAYRKRKRKDGYKYFSRLVTPEVYQKLKEYFDRLTVD